MHTMTKYYGQTKVTFNSPSGFFLLSPEERQEWFKKEWEAGNPIVRQLVDKHFEIEQKQSSQTI